MPDARASSRIGQERQVRAGGRSGAQPLSPQSSRFSRSPASLLSRAMRSSSAATRNQQQEEPVLAMVREEPVLAMVLGLLRAHVPDVATAGWSVEASPSSSDTRAAGGAGEPEAPAQLDHLLRLSDLAQRLPVLLGIGLPLHPHSARSRLTLLPDWRGRQAPRLVLRAERIGDYAYRGEMLTGSGARDQLYVGTVRITAALVQPGYRLSGDAPVWTAEGTLAERV
jgi:hypothetical protein